MEDVTLTEPRDALAEVTSLLTRHFGADLLGLYLFGSLAAGGFRPGKSDLDLFAVIKSDVQQGEQLEALRSLHTAFVTEHPDWNNRVEVGYISQPVLQTFGDALRGRIAVTSPGEPLHQKDAGQDWTLNWYSVCTHGQTLVGPPPLELGPLVTPDAYRLAIKAQLTEWNAEVRAPWVAYVPAHQGYVVVTLCRALYGLATGEQTTKENAVAWAAKQFPEWESFIKRALAQHRADVDEPHRATIQFVDHALKEAELVNSSPGRTDAPVR